MVPQARRIKPSSCWRSTGQRTLSPPSLLQLSPSLPAMLLLMQVSSLYGIKCKPHLEKCCILPSQHANHIHGCASLKCMYQRTVRLECAACMQGTASNDWIRCFTCPAATSPGKMLTIIDALHALCTHRIIKWGLHFFTLCVHACHSFQILMHEHLRFSNQHYITRPRITTLCLVHAGHSGLLVD